MRQLDDEEEQVAHEFPLVHSIHSSYAYHRTVNFRRSSNPTFHLATPSENINNFGWSLVDIGSVAGRSDLHNENSILN